MAETIENVQPNEPNTSTKPLSKDMVEKLLQEKSKHITITLTTVDDKKKRSECWKVFGFPKVDGVIYHEMAACHKWFTPLPFINIVHRKGTLN